MSLYPSGFLIPAGLLITGWTVETKSHWIGADVVSVIPILNPVRSFFLIPDALRVSSLSEPASYSSSKAFRHTPSILTRCIPLPVSQPRHFTRERTADRYPSNASQPWRRSHSYGRSPVSASRYLRQRCLNLWATGSATRCWPWLRLSSEFPRACY